MAALGSAEIGAGAEANRRPGDRPPEERPADDRHDLAQDPDLVIEVAAVDGRQLEHQHRLVLGQHQDVGHAADHESEDRDQGRQARHQRRLGVDAAGLADQLLGGRRPHGWKSVRQREPNRRRGLEHPREQLAARLGLVPWIERRRQFRWMRRELHPESRRSLLRGRELVGVGQHQEQRTAHRGEARPTSALVGPIGDRRVNQEEREIRCAG